MDEKTCLKINEIESFLKDVSDWCRGRSTYLYTDIEQVKFISERYASDVLFLLQELERLNGHLEDANVQLCGDYS